MLDVLLDGVNETRLKLISEDEARALMILLAVLDDHTQTEDIRRGPQARCGSGSAPDWPRPSTPTAQPRKRRALKARGYQDAGCRQASGRAVERGSAAGLSTALCLPRLRGEAPELR